MSGKISIMSTEYNFLTARNSAAIQAVSVNGTLTVNSQLTTSETLVVDTLTLSQLQVGRGTVPTSAALLSVAGDALSITQSAIVCNTPNTAVNGALVPQQGITVVAAFPGSALTFSRGILTSETSTAVMVVNTALLSPGSSDASSFALPLVATGTYNFTVDWGDASTSVITAYNQPEVTHTYAVPGFYTLTITGTLTGWVFAGDGDVLKLLDISAWGPLVLDDTGLLANFFQGCANLNVTAAIGSPVGAGTTSLAGCFLGCSVLNSANIGTWDVSAVQDMTKMFYFASAFNINLSSWDTSSVMITNLMFAEASVFNNGDTTNAGAAPLTWTTTNLLDTAAMFNNCLAFNQTLVFSSMTLVEYTSSMFSGASLFNNGETSNTGAKAITWNTPALVNTDSMFQRCTVFNQPLVLSDMSHVTTCRNMLSGCVAFKQNSLSAWTVTACANFTNFYTADLNQPDSATNQTNYDALLLAWAAQALQPGVTFDMGTTKYSAAAAASRTTLTTVYGWTVNDGGEALPMVMRVDTTNVSTGSSNDQSFALPLVATGTYDFIVEWGDGASSTITAYDQPDVVHTYATAGAYTLTITGTLTGCVFNDGGDKLKLLEISAWGNVVLGDAGETGFFAGCSNLNITAGAGSPLVPGTTSLAACFFGCASLNSTNVATWDVSAVRDISRMFAGASAFNVNLSSWNTSVVQNMNRVFADCFSFNNGDTTNAGGAALTWNTSQVTDVNSMFSNCTTFNQTVSFALDSVTDASNMLTGCISFNNGDVTNVHLKPLSWATPVLRNTSQMFLNCSAFNQAVAFSTTVAVTDMSSMFQGAALFNQTLLFDDTSSVTSMRTMFAGAATFNNGELTDNGSTPLTFNTGNVTSLDSMFNGASSFNQQLNFSDTSRASVTGMFAAAALFNNGGGVHPLVWNLASATAISSMFNGASVFDQQLVFTNTANVQDMSYAFSQAYAFNNGGAPLTLDTSSVLNTTNMFNLCVAFNQQVNFSDLSTLQSATSMFGTCSAFNNGDTTDVSSKPLVWTTTSLQSARAMFIGCTAFNQALTFSDLSQVTDFSTMLQFCPAFKQDLSAWTVTACTTLTGFYNGDMNAPNSAASTANYDSLLLAWATQALQPGLTFDMGTTKYSAAAAASRTTHTTVYGWTVNDGGATP